MTRPHLPRIVRSVAMAHALVALATVGLWFVPLFDLFGFEFAAAIGWLLAYVSGWRATAAAVRARRDDAAPPEFPGGALWRVGLENLSLLVTAALLMAINAWRVPVCNWRAGLEFYALLPLPAVLYGTALGFALGLALPLRRARTAFVLWSLVTYAHAIWKLIAAPPKFAFNAFIGWFPGPIYDTAIAPTQALVLARTSVVLQAIAVVILAALAWDGRRLALAKLRRMPRDVRAVLAAIGLLIVAALLALHLGRNALGLAIDRDYIQRSLGGRAESAHCVLYYDRATITAARAARLLQEHELRYTQLERFFGRAPRRKIGSYVYGSAAQKKRLMGAAGTSFEDALHDEFHINAASEDPHPVLTHEMAHIFAAHIDRWQPVCWKIGIHEGIAVAAEWNEESTRLELTPHQAAAAMDSLGILPDVARSLSAWGFWTQPGARAYTACGSFVRWLVDTHGIRQFDVLWHRGDFAAAFGEPLPQLVRAWKGFLAATPIGDAELRRAERLFRPPSVFAQPCAHEVAQIEARAASAAAGGDAAAARDLYTRLAVLDPDDPEPRLGLARARLRSGEWAAAGSAAEALADEPRLQRAVGDRAWRLAGDAAWLAGDLERADSCYARAGRAATSEADARAVEVTRAALHDGRLAPFLRDYLADLGLPDVAAVARLAAAERMAPDAALPHYLLGRRLYYAEQWPAAAEELRAALRDGDLGPLARRAASDLLGRSLLAAGEPMAAAAVFQALLATPLPAAVRLGIEDWRWRCEQTAAPATGTSIEPDR